MTHFLKYSVIVAGLLAQQAWSADLLQTWQAARDYDASYAAARYAREAGSEKKWQGIAPLLPQLNASASYSKTDNRPSKRSASNLNSPIGDGDNTRKTQGISLTQTVFDWAKFANLSISEQRSLIAEDQFRVAEQDLMLKVATAYFDVLLAEDTLTFTQAAKTAFARQLEQAKLSFKIGTATVVDTYEAQANYDNASAQEIAAQNDLAIKRDALRTLSNVDPQQLKPLGEALPLSLPQPAQEEAWLTRATAQNFELAAKQKQYTIAKKEVEVSRAGHLPTLQLKANWGRDTVDYRQGGGAYDTDGRSNSIAAEVVIPLFAGGGVQSQLREKAALAEQSREELEATRRKVTQDTRAAFLNVSNGAAQVKAREETLKSVKSQLEATRLGREVGVRTSLDILNAERAYQDARRNLAQARYDYLKARLRLAAQVGELNPEVLADINRLLQGKRS